MNDKKVVLITGGAMGQGRGHAYKYAENNFDVVLGDMLEPENESFQETIQECQNKGAKVLAMRCDITNNDDMEKLMVSEEDLYRLAKKNTKELFPSYVKPLYKVIQILSGLNEEADPDIPAEEMPYVVSNKNNCFGAHVMLYPEIFSDLANKLEADLFILPSSIHEVMAISTKSGGGSVRSYDYGT